MKLLCLGVDEFKRRVSRALLLLLLLMVGAAADGWLVQSLKEVDFELLVANALQPGRCCAGY